MNILQPSPKLLQCFGMLFHKIHNQNNINLCFYIYVNDISYATFRERDKTKENKWSSHLPHYYWQKTCKLDVCLLKLILLLTGVYIYNILYFLILQLDTNTLLTNRTLIADWTLLYASLKPSVHMKGYTNILMCQRQNQAINKQVQIHIQRYTYASLCTISYILGVVTFNILVLSRISSQRQYNAKDDVKLSLCST